MAYNIGHLVETAVIQTFHGVQDTALYRFEAIHKMRYGPLQDNI
jgi:hypothetical protein